MGLGWILIIVVIAVMVWLLVRGPLVTGGRGQSERPSALDVLKERYARGEIGREEFEQKRRDLES